MTQTEGKQEPDQLEQLTNEVVKGGSIAFIGISIVRATTFGLHILLARTLGPAAYGLYALGRSMIAVLRPVASLGLDQGIVRYVAVYRAAGDKEQIKGTILSAVGISSTFSMLIAFALFVLARVISDGFFDEPNLAIMLKAFALTLPFYVLITMTTASAQSFRRIEYQQGITIFRSLADLCFVGLALLLGFGLVGVIYGFLTSALFSAGVGFYFLWRMFPDIVSRLRSVYKLCNLLRFSIPILFVAFSHIILNSIDRIMLGHFSQASEIGIYSAAANVAMLLPTVLVALSSITSPIIANLHNQGDLSKLSIIYQTVTRWIFTLTLPIFLVFVFASRGIMQIFGAEYVKGASVLIILSSGQLVNASTGSIGKLLEMTGNQDVSCVAGIILATLNIGLNFWLIPLFGASGAAIATTISNTLIYITLVFFAYRVLEINLYSVSFIRPVVSGTVATVLTIMIGRMFHIVLFDSLNVVEVISILLFYSLGMLILPRSKEDALEMGLIRNKIIGRRREL